MVPAAFCCCNFFYTHCIILLCILQNWFYYLELASCFKIVTKPTENDPTRHSLDEKEVIETNLLNAISINFTGFTFPLVLPMVVHSTLWVAGFGGDVV